MRSFASTFARPTRKAAFRKHCLALDTKFTGKLSRKWLQAAVGVLVDIVPLSSFLLFYTSHISSFPWNVQLYTPMDDAGSRCHFFLDKVA